MDKKLKHMLHQLKGKTFPDSLHKELGRYGDKAFDLLLDLAKSKVSTDKEVSNALSVMHHMCGQPCTHRSQDLFELSLSLLRHSSVLVRSRAIKVVIGLIRVSTDYPEICKLDIADKKTVKASLFEAKNLGIDKETESYLDWWVSQVDHA